MTRATSTGNAIGKFNSAKLSSQMSTSRLRPLQVIAHILSLLGYTWQKAQPAARGIPRNPENDAAKCFCRSYRPKPGDSRHHLPHRPEPEPRGEVSHLAPRSYPPL